MDREEKLIEKIIENGKAESKATIQKAKKDADVKLSEANTKASGYIEWEVTKAKNECREQLKIEKQKANLKENKSLLFVKNSVVEKIFEIVLDKLVNLKEDKVLDYFEKLLAEYAEKNDFLVLSKNQKKLQEQIEKLKSFKEKNLKIKSTDGDFKGGFILENDIRNLDLTYEGILAEYRENYITEIVRELF